MKFKTILKGFLLLAFFAFMTVIFISYQMSYDQYSFCGKNGINVKLFTPKDPYGFISNCYISYKFATDRNREKILVLVDQKEKSYKVASFLSHFDIKDDSYFNKSDVIHVYILFFDKDLVE